ncbi:hypothetical protein LNP74_19310 [Klebsiella pneumoniae subsp. pneumoniae]|nr:hypothetical protein [Klebsiella pneumoniae subsp. pneumoniae]
MEVLMRWRKKASRKRQCEKINVDNQARRLAAAGAAASVCRAGRSGIVLLDYCAGGGATTAWI